MVKMNTMFGYSAFLRGILGDQPWVISLILALVAGVGHPNCDTSVCYFPEKSEVTGAYFILTHCGRVTQICVFTLQLCRTGDADLRF